MKNNIYSFIDIFNELSDEYKYALTGTMMRLQHTEHSEVLSKKWQNYSLGMKERQKQLGMTDEDVVGKVNDISGAYAYPPQFTEFTLGTYRDMRKQNPQKSKWYNLIAEALDTSVQDLGAVKTKMGMRNISIMLKDFMNIEWLYESLTENDKIAVFYLAEQLKNIQKDSSNP